MNVNIAANYTPLAYGKQEPFSGRHYALRQGPNKLLSGGPDVGEACDSGAEPAGETGVH